MSLYLVSCYSQRRTLQGEKQIFAEEPFLFYNKHGDKAAAKGKTELSYYYLHKFDTEYDRLMKLVMRNALFLLTRHRKRKGGRKKEKKDRSSNA